MGGRGSPLKTVTSSCFLPRYSQAFARGKEVQLVSLTIKFNMESDQKCLYHHKHAQSNRAAGDRNGDLPSAFAHSLFPASGGQLPSSRPYTDGGLLSVGKTTTWSRWERAGLFVSFQAMCKLLASDASMSPLLPSSLHVRF